MTTREQGFSLMEALVALLVIGIAGAGVARTVQSHIDSIRALEMRSAAQWVAENRLVELGLERQDDRENQRRETMLGHQWLVTTRFAPSDDPDLRQVFVTVKPEQEDGPDVTLRGFFDAGTITP